LHLIRLFFYPAKVPITNHPRQPAWGWYPFLHSAQIQSQGQNPLEQAHVSRAQQHRAHDRSPEDQPRYRHAIWQARPLLPRRTSYCPIRRCLRYATL